MRIFILELVITHIALILAYWVFLKKENEYQKMRYFLLGSTLFSIAIPLFRLPKLFYSSHAALHELPVEYFYTSAPVVAATSEISNFSFQNLVLCSLVVSSIFLLKLITTIFYLIRLEHRSSIESYNGYRIRRVAGGEGSFTFFNWIFISEDIDINNKESKAILMHEQAHARLRHSFDLVFFEIYKSFFWWLPSAWYINREIKRIHEYQADAYALRSFNVDLYSSIIIKSTLQSNGLNIASSFHDGLIFKRLKAMKKQVKKVNQWKYGMLTSLCVFLFISLACSEEKDVLNNANLQTTLAQVEQEVFTIVEEQPSYKGGMSAFYHYIMNEIRYPIEARNAKVEGVVDVQFVVERDGSISNVRAVKGIGSGCDQEAVRVMGKAPDFNPGKQRGRAVRVAMAIPITFKLNSNKKNPDNSIHGAVIAGELASNVNALKVRANYANGVWSGTVYSPEGEVLAGVNIVVGGTSKGTVSDRDGTFSIETQKDEKLHVSFVGYKNVMLTANDNE